MMVCVSGNRDIKNGGDGEVEERRWRCYKVEIWKGMEENVASYIQSNFSLHHKKKKKKLSKP